MKRSDAIPVTILTGFLGSGKTTLLNRILTENHGKKIAVIENEFGEIGVDNELVIGADEEIFEMNNGCICCTVRGDLIRILGQLLKRKDRLDHVIVETTGLANPAPVAQTFWVDEDMKEHYSLDAIVTLVDSKHIWQHLDDSSECQEQVAFADVVLLNKIDLVGPAELDTLEKRIHGMNSHAKIYKVQNAVVPMDQILNVHAFDLTHKAELNPEFLIEEYPFEWAGIFDLNEFEYQLGFLKGPDETMDILVTPITALEDELIKNSEKNAIIKYSEKSVRREQRDFLRIGGNVNTLHLEEEENIFRIKVPKPGKYAFFTQHLPEEFDMQLVQSESLVSPIWLKEYEHSHTHDNLVTSVGIEDEGALDLEKLNQWLDYLLSVRGTDIFRMKGILNIKGNDARFVFQGVHMLFDGKADRKWRMGEKRRNQLVFIGKSLDRKELVSGFRECLA